MKFTRYIFLAAIMVCAGVFTASAQKDGDKDRPPKDPPKIIPKDPKPAPTPTPDKGKKPNLAMIKEDRYVIYIYA